MKSKLLFALALILSGGLIGCDNSHKSSVAVRDTMTGNASVDLTAHAVVQKCLATYAALSSYSDNGKTVESDFDGQSKNTTFHIRMQRPNLFRVTWVQIYGNVTNTGLWRSAVTDGFAEDDSVVMITTGRETNGTPVYEALPFALTDLALKAGDITLVPDIFFRFRSGNILEKSYSGHFEMALSSGKIGMDDCYLVTLNQGARITNAPTVWITRLWIGKRDFLLHQVQSSITDAKFGERRITQTHEQMATNKIFTVEDFEPKLPETHSSITLHSAPPATARLPRLKNILLTTPTSSASLDSDIVLLSAEFGMGEKIADVTARVGKLLCSPPERFIVSAQSLGTDPLPGKKKRLVIRYEYRGATNTLTQSAGHLMSREALSLDADKYN
jgi:outer membrane lipoprotein-sorting protein